MDDDTITFDISPEVISVTSDDPITALTLDLNSVMSTPVVFYKYVQSSPSDTWTINHNLGEIPIVQVFNAGSQEVEANVVHLSVNQTIVYFNTPQSGFAKLI